MNVKKWYKTVRNGANAILERPLLTSFIVLCIVALVVLSLSAPYYRNNFEAFYSQVLAEAHGMIFDIAIIGILLVWLNHNGEKRMRIRMYKDEIDDFRLWESEEAAFRTVGNIKRLNRHKIFNINLANCHLERTNLNYINLKESNLNLADLSNTQLIGSNLEKARMNQTSLENATLNQASLLAAYASGANFQDAFLIKANLKSAFLIKANFRNAFLMEANLNGAYVTDANFENSNLYKADLRNTIGLTIEQLKNVKTLHLAQFDNHIFQEIKQRLPQLLDG